LDIHHGNFAESIRKRVVVVKEILDFLMGKSKNGFIGLRGVFWLVDGGHKLDLAAPLRHSLGHGIMGKFHTRVES